MQVVSFATAHFDGNRGWHRRSNGNKPWPTSVILILCIACYAEHDKTRLPCICAADCGSRGFGVAVVPPRSEFLLDGLDQVLRNAGPLGSVDDAGPVFGIGRPSSGRPVWPLVDDGFIMPAADHYPPWSGSSFLDCVKPASRSESDYSDVLFGVAVRQGGCRWVRVAGPPQCEFSPSLTEIFTVFDHLGSAVI